MYNLVNIKSEKKGKSLRNKKKKENDKLHMCLSYFPSECFSYALIVMRRERRHVYCANLSLDVLHLLDQHEIYIYEKTKTSIIQQ
jgi:hypothetical protein